MINIVKVVIDVKESNFKESESKPKINDTKNKIKYVPDIYFIKGVLNII